VELQSVPDPAVVLALAVRSAAAQGPGDARLADVGPAELGVALVVVQERLSSAAPVAE